MTPLLNVAEINRSLAFYQRLGFVVVARTLSDIDDEIIWAMLCSEGGSADQEAPSPVRLMLAAHGGVSHEERRMRPPFSGMVLYLECDDLTSLFEDLQAEGFKPEPVETLSDGARQFFVRDPDGYEIALGCPGDPPAGQAG
jgi:catechol 2,3-dioxygenase-like lactoylglutathione lyase family enzyme